MWASAYAAARVDGQARVLGQFASRYFVPRSQLDPVGRGPPDVQRGAFCRSRPSVRGHRGVGWVTAAAAAIVLAATACAATPVAKAPRTPICPLTSRARPLVEKLTTEDDPVDL